MKFKWVPSGEISQMKEEMQMKKAMLAVAVGLSFAAIGSAAESATFKELDRNANVKAAAEPVAGIAASQPLPDSVKSKMYKATIKLSKPINDSPCDLWTVFSDLEQLGVERKAEIAALNECHKAGETTCFSSTVSSKHCNVTEQDPVVWTVKKVVCVADAVAVAIK
ncbi:MAG: hypothetical protein PHP45_04655 [Elusimicrobiales bacterium]|nr:hypothetical protein [Elusimicrobiales bacterium]